MRFLQTAISLLTANLALAAPVSLEKRQALFAGKNFSILPLGDSITYGFASSTGNGYRASLLSTLTSAGATIDLVGTQRSGTMSDPDNEGHNGWVIDQITGAATSAANAGIVPDVVLVHAGTNDANGNRDIANAGDRLTELVDMVVEAWPEASVLVAQIVASKTGYTQANIESINAQIPGIVQAQQSQGRQVGSVDMGSTLQAGDFADALHPNDQGYAKMAAVWVDGLQDLVSRGWI